MAAIAQLVNKFTWLMDNVEVKGIVAAWEEGTNKRLPDNAEVGEGDTFDVLPDENYKHLVNYVPGFGAYVKCETYPIEPAQINRVDPWCLPKKPQEVFFVDDPSAGKRPLRVGDHVRVIGRWVQDHHPENCVTQQISTVGIIVLKVGCSHVEFHPFQWDNITLVTAVDPDKVVEETLSVAAPLHEEIFLRDGKWVMNEVAGVASKIFVNDAVTNYHATVTANAHIKAPPLPAGFTPHSSLIGFRENVLQNGTGLAVAQIRSQTVVEDGIKLTATVTAPASFPAIVIPVGPGSINIADVNDPAINRSIFQAKYSVWWLPRLIAVSSASTVEPIETVQLAPQIVGTTTKFSVFIRNRGPDSLQLTEADIYNNEGLAFDLDSVSGRSVPAWSTVELEGTFSPPRWLPGTFPTYPPYTVTAVIHIKSTDPVCESTEINIQGQGVPAPQILDVRVAPGTVDFGLVYIGQSVTQDVFVWNFDGFDVDMSRPVIISETPTGQFGLVTSAGPDVVIPSGHYGHFEIIYAPYHAGTAIAKVRTVVTDMRISNPKLPIELIITVQWSSYPDTRP